MKRELARVSSEDERGWRAYLTVDEDEPAVAGVLLPGVRRAEFGGAGARPAN